MDKRYLTNRQCIEAAMAMVAHIRTKRILPGDLADDDLPGVYGVPRGGVPVAYLVSRCMAAHHPLIVSDNASVSNIIVDDIVDSGATRARYREKYPDIPFLALADFLPGGRLKGQWIVFPWEKAEDGDDTSGDDIVLRLLAYIGEDPKREGLKETPRRVLRAWKDWTSGYGKDPLKVMKTFTDGAEQYDEMIVVRDLPFYSHCEHHLAPFFGTATIAYIPAGKVVGLSKLGRVLDIFARRLQVQERLTTQIALALEDALKPKGVGVVIKARHLCMESRGLQTQGHHTVTSALRGAFFDNEKARAEFFSIAK